MKLLKRIFKILLALVLLLLISIPVILLIDNQSTSYLKIAKNESAQNNSYIIKNVNIIPMYKDTVLTNKAVHIKEGIIENISDDITINNVNVIDAKGSFLMPGLIDMHVHVWDRYELGLYLSNGVTAIRSLWGMPMHLRIKEAINNQEILGPSFFTTGPKLTGPEFMGDDNLQLTSPEMAKEKVASYKERGYDFIKTYYGLTEDIFDAVIEQAKASDIDIVAHPTPKVPYSYHFNPQIKSIEHTEDIVQQPLNYKLDTIQLNTIINEYAKVKHSSFCPTLVVYNNIYQMLIDDTILESPEVQYINPIIKKTDSEAQFERWFTTKQQDSTIVSRIKNQHEFHLTIIEKLHNAGVNIVCGTDSGIGVTPAGISIHKELAFYKDAKLSNFEVLQTATVNPSKTHKIMRNMGTIEVGKIANLIILDNNPLQDLKALKKPSAVFINGRMLNKDLLENFKNKAYNRNNLLATAIRYVENLWVEK